MVETRSPPSLSLDTVLVEVGGQTLGIPLTQVIGALQMVALHPLPGAPMHCLGSFCYLGDVLVVVDLAARLGLQRSTRRAYQRALLIVEGPDGSAGLAVDRVVKVGVARLPGPSLLPTQPVTRGLLRGFWVDGDAWAPVLDASALLGTEERGKLRALLTLRPEELSAGDDRAP